jgi:TetR/AcrR family transcriptional regulator
MRGSSTRRPGRRDRRRDAAGTREALLLAGAELFATKGYEGAPVWTIAARAGVNKAMISYHFGGKRKLYRAILDATFSEVIALVERLADSPRPAPDLLRELVADVADLATRRYPHFCAMMLREVLAGGKRLDQAVVAQPARVLAAVERIVERGVREGTLRPVDPVLTHLNLVGGLVFFFATAQFRARVLAASHLGRRSPDAPAYARHVQDLITHGLAATETHPGTAGGGGGSGPRARRGRSLHPGGRRA